MRRCAIVFLVCLFAGLDVQAGKEYPAKPGEEVVANELIVRLMPGARGELSGSQTEPRRNRLQIVFTAPYTKKEGIYPGS